MPGPAERTSSTEAPAFVSTVQVAHEQHSGSTATSLRSSSSTPGSGRKDMRRPSDVWVHSVMALAMSRSQRPACAARPAEVRVQATGTVPPAWPEVVCDVVMIAIVVVKVGLMSKPLSIGEVARLAGRRASSIRYYEQIGLLPEAARVAGRRVYGPGVMRTLAVIETGQRAGLTLQEIKVLLAASPDDAAAVERLREVAERKLPEIADLIARSLLVRDWLGCAAHCECPSLDDCPLFDDPPLLPGRDDADTNGLQPGRRQT
jgi:MerR family transcriptional regulator, redox-sensitive transcriptional activator SoxR